MKWNRTFGGLLVAAALFVGAGAAVAADNDPTPGPGGGNVDCQKCMTHGWGPTIWSECIDASSGGGSGCEPNKLGKGGCTFTGGCVSLPDDQRTLHGLAL